MLMLAQGRERWRGAGGQDCLFQGHCVVRPSFIRTDFPVWTSLGPEFPLLLAIVIDPPSHTSEKRIRCTLSVTTQSSGKIHASFIIRELGIFYIIIDYWSWTMIQKSYLSCKHISLCHTWSRKVMICQEMWGVLCYFYLKPEVAKYLTRKLFLSNRSLKSFCRSITFF